MIAGEAHPRFFPQIFDALARRVVGVAERRDRLPPREQQVALDQVRQPEIGIAGDDFVDFGECGTDAIVTDFPQGPVEQGVHFLRGGIRAVHRDSGGGGRRSSGPLRLLVYRENRTAGGAEQQRQRVARGAEPRVRGECCKSGVQLPARSCWMSHLSPSLTMTNVFVLETLRLPDW